MPLSLFLTPDTVPAQTPLPGNTQALVNLIAQYISIAGGSSFTGLNFGPATPSPENRGNPWFQTDAQGNPIGFLSWNGTAWVTLPSNLASGPTSNRPTNAAVGGVYYDTTIKCLILWNGANWTTASGSIGDIKDVQAVDLPTALVNNPGWSAETSSIGCVIAAAGAATPISAAHAYGSIIGEENHQLVITEIPSHTHTTSWGNFPGQFQNGSQSAGVVPAVTPGSTTIALVPTGSTGADTGHNTIQPTAYFFRLVKTS